MELGKFIPALCMILGLMKPSTAIDEDCYFQQNLQHGLTYYVYNPNYPGYYQGRRSCQWQANSDSRIRLNCQEFTIPGSRNCSREALIVQVSEDIEYTFCGLNSFVVESLTSQMIIKFHSRYNSLGGRFRCELTAIEEQCSCGWKNPNRIIGGVETGVNEFPMMAGLVSIADHNLFCGATVITEKHVITAAHCVTLFKDDISDLAVIVGEHDTKRGDETNATQLYSAESIIIHPEYENKGHYADVAIVKSSGKFKFSMRVGPACLPFYYTQRDFAGDDVTALGWGTLSFGGKKSNTLMKVDLHVISQKVCADEYDDITPKKMCTYNDGKDACQFDSGGPILWQNQRTNRVMLVGVISYGRMCADESPGVNTRVTSYLDFIQSATRGYNYCKAL